MQNNIAPNSIAQNSIVHVAIVPDGNGRWAVNRGKPRFYGHNQGAKAILRCIKDILAYKIPIATFYIFSTENWTRPKDEIKLLMQLFRLYAENNAKSLQQQNVAIHFFGRLEQLEKQNLQIIEKVTKDNPQNPDLKVYFAINYGGRGEIIDACKKIAEKINQGKIKPQHITEKQFNKELYIADCPEPDFVLRTAGEKRISNFLLWQTAYSEFIHADFLWPDYQKENLDEAIKQFVKRRRKFGGIVERQNKTDVSSEKITNEKIINEEITSEKIISEKFAQTKINQ